MNSIFGLPALVNIDQSYFQIFITNAFERVHHWTRCWYMLLEKNKFVYRNYWVQCRSVPGSWLNSPRNFKLYFHNNFHLQLANLGKCVIEAVNSLISVKMFFCYYFSFMKYHLISNVNAIPEWNWTNQNATIIAPDVT